jgi:nicotinamide mononucleotide adenylyltransferase
METIAKTSNTAYFTFGRFQPPTIGHGLLINFVAQEASKANADAFIFVSSTKNKSISLKRVPNLEEKPDFRNPLNLNTKITTLQKMFPDKVQYIDTQQNDCNNPFKAIDKLLSLGYEQLFFVVGSDR